MNKAQRDIRRKKRVLEHAARIGATAKWNGRTERTNRSSIIC